MLGRSLLNFIHAEAVHTLRNQLHIVNMTGTTARLFGIQIDDTPRRFDLAVHTLDGLVVLECEPSVADSSVNASALVRGTMNRVQGMRDPRTLSRVAARELRALTGFDRVMVSILREGRLWGLFACHHYSPLHVSFERRTAAELFGQMFSLLMENREREAESGYENRARELHNRLVQDMVGEEMRIQSIGKHLDDIADQLTCDGIGLSLGSQATLHGMTPDQEQFARLIRHLRTSLASSDNYASNEIRFEIAIRLLMLGVPFAFMTGYGESEAFPEELAHVPRIRKPFTQQSLAVVLGRRR